MVINIHGGLSGQNVRLSGDEHHLVMGRRRVRITLAFGAKLISRECLANNCRLRDRTRGTKKVPPCRFNYGEGLFLRSGDPIGFKTTSVPPKICFPPVIVEC